MNSLLKHLVWKEVIDNWLDINNVSITIEKPLTEKKISMLSEQSLWMSQTTDNLWQRAQCSKTKNILSRMCLELLGL